MSATRLSRGMTTTKTTSGRTPAQQRRWERVLASMPDLTRLRLGDYPASQRFTTLLYLGPRKRRWVLLLIDQERCLWPVAGPLAWEDAEPLELGRVCKYRRRTT